MSEPPIPEEPDDDFGSGFGGFFGLFDEVDSMMGRHRHSRRPPRPGIVAPGRLAHARTRYNLALWCHASTPYCMPM